jgi:hypothetical protein
MSLILTLSLALFLIPAGTASAMVVALIDPARVPPAPRELDRSELPPPQSAELGSLESGVATTIGQEAPGDMSIQAANSESEVNKALRECAMQGIAEAAAAAADGESQGGITQAFETTAAACLSHYLSGLSPTARAISDTVSYLQQIAADSQSPQSSGTATNGPGNHSGFPLWGLLVGGGFVLFGLAKAVGHR